MAKRGRGRQEPARPEPETALDEPRDSVVAGSGGDAEPEQSEPMDVEAQPEPERPELVATDEPVKAPEATEAVDAGALPGIKGGTAVEVLDGQQIIHRAMVRFGGYRVRLDEAVAKRFERLGKVRLL